jgi:single-strand DNA-binding protein
MASVNKVFLVGNLTRDPELRRLPNGTAVTELGLAVNNSYTTKDGEKKEDTLFVDVTVWAGQAENAVQYLKKGSPVHIEGALKMDSWEDKTSGERRTKLKVQADRVQFLNGGKGRDNDEEEASPKAVDKPKTTRKPRVTASVAVENEDDNDVPF